MLPSLIKTAFKIEELHAIMTSFDPSVSVSNFLFSQSVNEAVETIHALDRQLLATVVCLSFSP